MLVKQMNATELGINESFYLAMVEKEDNPVYRKVYSRRLRMIRDEMDCRTYEYGKLWRVLDQTGVV